MDTQRVKDRMKDMGIKPVDMATEMGIDVSTYYRKMKNNKFTALDLLVFKRELHLNEHEALDFLLS